MEMDIEYTSKKDDISIDYLEIYWWGTKHTYDNVRKDGNMLGLHGLGKLGDVPEDVLKYSKPKLTKKEKLNYRSAIAVEFTPIYKLAHLPIKISKKLHITDYDVDISKKNPDLDIDFQPSITLIDLLYAIFYELSFCGGPKQRDERRISLIEQVDKIEKAYKEGKLDEISTPYKKVKKRILAKIKGINKDKKNFKDKR
jgi:hypothetical protein